MAIYTKLGDKGRTKVFDRKSGKLTGISKDSCKIISIGTIDELNSLLGVTASLIKDKKLHKILTDIQADLFTINSILAGGKLRFSKTKIKKLEKQIDVWEGMLPVLKNFIFYGGTYEASMTFYSRAICRRAERSLVNYSKKYLLKPEISGYMNRLSDYLFMMARYINFNSKIKETAWRR